MLKAEIFLGLRTGKFTRLVLQLQVELRWKACARLGDGMAAKWDLAAVAEGFQSAAFDPTQWMPALDRLVVAVGATGITLIPFSVDNRPIGVTATAGAAEATARYVKEGWYKHDPRARSIPKLLATGIAVDQDIATTEEMRRSPHYNELLGRLGLRWFAGVAFSAGPDNWCLAIQRTSKQGPFTPPEQERLVTLCRPLTSVATIASELGLARARGMVEAYDLSGAAAFLLDSQGQVIRTNNAAEAVLGHDLRIVNKRLTANDDQTSNVVGRLVWQAIGSFEGGTNVMQPVALPRAGRRPLMVYALPPAGVVRDVFCSVRALLVVRDLEANPRPPESVLRAYFGLTPAEARLAMRLASGEAVETVANEFGITYETARNQLKAVYAKTDTHRQAELVALLGRMLAGP